ncbi:hypothetical protein F2Q68_00032742 [Brassica cretica]|uniref:Uncharacterized protein n=1 Tax=Brassica cretica TaxID=69181 RepID=A0A8S9GBY6_BRACR|nr:hypothetical protein F2Q68_00032742 [Brassica cretica]
MCSSHGDKRNSDVEKGEATSPAPIPTSPVEAPSCVADHLSFQERLVRRQAEQEQVRASAEFLSSSAVAIAPGHGTEVVTPRDTGTLAGSVVPDALVLPAGSSMSLILVEDKERAADSMPPPPARKEIVLALRAPSAVPVAQPKGRKKKFTKGGDGESSQQGVSSIASGLRGKVCRSLTSCLSPRTPYILAPRARSLCSDRAERTLGRYVATELRLELGRYVATEWNERSVATSRPSGTDARSLRSDRAEYAFGRCVATFFELLSDVSCFLRKAFLSPQLVRVETLAGGLTILAKLGVLNEVYFKLRGREFLRNSKSFAFNMSSSHGDKRSSDVEMGEATSSAPIPTSPVEVPACVADHLSFRERLVRRQAEKEQVRAGTEFPSSSALAIAPGHGTEVVTPRDAGTLAGSVVPDASALPTGSSTTPILVEDKEKAADSMPPPPARKEIVLALRAPSVVPGSQLRAPSVVPVAQPKGQKRKFTKGGDGESSQQGDSSMASGLRGKFMSLIDGMISECGSETSRLAGELLELQGRWSETEAMLTAVKDSHSVKVSKLEVAIGELERDLGKTASSLLKEKKARKAKSSKVHHFQRQIFG